MSQNAFSELGLLSQTLKKNVSMDIFSIHSLLNFNKNDLFKYAAYIKNKFCVFVKYYIEHSNWIVFVDSLIFTDILSIQSLFISEFTEKEKLENFLKNLPFNILFKVSLLFCNNKKKKEKNKIFRQKFEIFTKTIYESKGDVFLMTRYETNNQYMSNCYFPEIFQIYLEQLRIYIDNKQKRIGKIILNNYIKNFFPDPVLQDFKFCLFEQLLRIFSETKLEKNNFCKIYLARCYDLIKKKKKFEKISFDTELKIIFFLMEKECNPKKNINREITFIMCLCKKKKVFVQLLMNFYTCQLIIWSFFKPKIEKEINSKKKNFSGKDFLLLFSFIRSDVINKNFLIFLKSFNSVSLNHLSQIIELDTIDINFWLRILNSKSNFKILIDCLEGNVFLNSKKKFTHN